jgi:NAD(P)-dependent dehydrogenase (short-subunit alcohol dehydrogenase family)
MSIRYDGRVAIVTGAGNGLGRSHAIELAKRGARVVVNDLGGARDGTGGSSEAARAVVAEIEAAGGEAIANGANVAKFDEVEAMVQEAMDKWGRVDILVNNAGILRDKSFGKGTMDDFRLVLDVHLMGSVYCTRACWDIMKAQEYGRIVVTTSSSGLYGNFGQTNYGAAKMGVIGMMNTLVQEGAKYNIRVNALAPTAGTRMTEGPDAREGLGTADPGDRHAGGALPGQRGRPQPHDPVCRSRQLRRGEDRRDRGHLAAAGGTDPGGHRRALGGDHGPRG